MAQELMIYTDESKKDGEYFSNFYGSVLVPPTMVAAEIEPDWLKSVEALGLDHL